MKDFSLNTRRRFLRQSVLGGSLALSAPMFISRTFGAMGDAAAADPARSVDGANGTILVVLQMAGGNDGLNTVVPVGNDHYHRARPKLGFKGGSLEKLAGGEFAFHPALSPFQKLMDDGLLAVLHGVGYPNPNRSHFRSTEIWQTASEASRFERHGWLGRYFDNACKGSEPAFGVAIGRQTPQAFAGPRPLGISMANPESYRLGSNDMRMEGETSDSREFLPKMNEPSLMEGPYNADSGATIGSLAGSTQSGVSPLDFLERTAMDAQLSSTLLQEASRKASNKASYPASQLGGSLKLVARLIAGALPTRVYYVSQGGYDTHAGQVPAHERLLGDLGVSLAAFMADLRAQHVADRVLIMTFSEFGRRLAENANGGTDHGAAAPMFLLGSMVKPGFHGTPSSLSPADLLNGDPRFTADFRGVYAGVLGRWMGMNSSGVLGPGIKPLTSFLA